VFNDVTPNEEDESTSKTKQNNPTKSATAYILSTAQRMLTECVQRQTVTCLSWPLEGNREDKLNIL
jgi:hypothetical protein